MKLLISFIVSFIITEIIFEILKKKNKYEKIEYIENEILLTTKSFLFIKREFMDVNKIRYIFLKKLSFNLIDLKHFEITNLSIGILDNEKKINLIGKKNVLIILKLIQKYNTYIFEKFINSEPLDIPGLRKTLEKELENINV